jgi:hypothetical protein
MGAAVGYPWLLGLFWRGLLQACSLTVTSSDRGASTNVGTAKLRKLIAGSFNSRSLLSHFLKIFLVA